jgi:hypothetical protein
MTCSEVRLRCWPWSSTAALSRLSPLVLAVLATTARWEGMGASVELTEVCVLCVCAIWA